MTTTARARPTERPAMDPLRRTALLAGALYVLTFISIPVLGLYGPVHDPLYVVGPGPNDGVVYGGLLELTVAFAGIGTAITLFPVVRRQNESLALGFVATRPLEAALIFVGVVSLFSVVTLRQDLGAAGDPSLVASGRALVAVYDATFLLGLWWARVVRAGRLLHRWLTDSRRALRPVADHRRARVWVPSCSATSSTVYVARHRTRRVRSSHRPARHQ